MGSPCSVCLSPRKTGIVEPEETVVARHWIGQHVPAATNTQATIELLDAVFSILSVSFHIYSVCGERKLGD
jgi:hypothetical protein